MIPQVARKSVRWPMKEASLPDGPPMVLRRQVRAEHHVVHDITYRAKGCERVSALGTTVTVERWER